MGRRKIADPKDIRIRITRSVRRDLAVRRENTICQQDTMKEIQSQPYYGSLRDRNLHQTMKINWDKYNII
jgi:hypothetical protein